MELKNAIDLFIGRYQNAGTREAYQYVLVDMRDFIGPKRLVSEIRPEHLEEYHQHVQKRDLSPATVRKYVKTFKTFYLWAVRIELIDKSPAREVTTPGKPHNVSREKAMTDEELDQILDYVKWKPRDHALILFLADTGCRAGGAASLTLNNLDIPNRHAKVTEKGDKTRPVAFGDLCAHALQVWLIRRPAKAGIFVFSRKAEPLTSATISQAVRRACKMVGIRSLGAHSLRHRKGHQFADGKIAPTLAATALGHKNITTTLEHYYPGDWESAEKELRRLAVADTSSQKIIHLREEHR
jgi:site-specific recombinase XerD